MSNIPRLIGVVHLPPLPGSPQWASDISTIAERAAHDAGLLEEAGFEAAIVENYGDVPFLAGSVAPVTVAAMTRCTLAIAERAPQLALGINVLRNDAAAALAIAAATPATMVRINIHTGARLTDQGIIEGRAHDTLRQRRELKLDEVKLLCDLAVKHSAPLGEQTLEQEAQDLSDRGLADAVLITGSGTGQAADPSLLKTTLEAVSVPVLVASGVSADTLPHFRSAHGVIVGSCLRADGKAGGPIDRECALRFADAFHNQT